MSLVMTLAVRTLSSKVETTWQLFPMVSLQDLIGDLLDILIVNPKIMRICFVIARWHCTSTARAYVFGTDRYGAIVLLSVA
ncbi:MAG: hypothetical protein A2074_07805 [Candidatus Aquicultor primus]|uniref:Uncharacterized protein n=1 Tax=Candidatus Aquicultor primus TaxID=1797195 RepID=A0A1F2UQL0_9ACTN|nr:MAG: hypothetical protein A2074_07805 [Candidatus Aquicultor primus]HCH00239.1 hypothetical protein [Actinomycetota bacterium]